MQIFPRVKWYNQYAGAVAEWLPLWCMVAVRCRGGSRESIRSGGAGVRIEDFYVSPQWRRKRELILRRDGYRCQECRRYGRITQANTVHHIQHLEDRPDLALVSSNLVSLCRACHAKAHPEKGGARPGSGEGQMLR